MTHLTEEKLVDAWRSRRALLSDLEQEKTTCYRMFHGVAEGRPGLTIDRYGPVMLVQTWRTVVNEAELQLLAALAKENKLTLAYNHRARPINFDAHFEMQPIEATGTEFGIEYDVRPRHRGQDPLIFLDFRAARRKVMSNSLGKRVLNLFSYTCGIGQVAHTFGATRVTNIDFAASALEVGEANARRNPRGRGELTFFHSDCLPALWQLAGRSLPKKRGPAPKIERQEFDLIILDPPRVSKGRFGKIDVRNDYPSLLKPVVQCCASGGHVLASNHLPDVSIEDWQRVLVRTVEKAGRTVDDLEFFGPEPDFPSTDGHPPLKLAWMTVG